MKNAEDSKLLEARNNFNEIEAQKPKTTVNKNYTCRCDVECHGSCHYVSGNRQGCGCAGEDTWKGR